jgi:cell division protein FtsI (penicillin-binding protein 3)
MVKTRQYLVLFIFILFLFAFLVRLFLLQVVNNEKFNKMAEEQHNAVMKLVSSRGAIFDRYLEPLAVSNDILSISANPRQITKKEKVAELIGDILGIDRAAISRKLQKDKAFVWIKRKVPEDKINKIKKLNISGIYFSKESKRLYPNDTMASHLIGFVGMDNIGLEGLELKYDQKLKGESGYRHIIRDARLRPVLYDQRDYHPAKDGHNVVLTIDSVIQFIAEEELAKMAVKHDVESAFVVMNPYTGEILAMAVYPWYDPNNYNETDKSKRKNSAVCDIFEPGSVFKIVTASAAINEDIVDIEEMISCENGEYKVGGRILHDYHPYGKLSFKDVIIKSSNIGTVKVAIRLGEQKLYEYIQKFGFGSKTGIDLVGEVPGISRPPRIWSRSDITTIPIGQGIAVTAVQMAACVSVIANGGYLVTPYVLDRISSWEGETIEKTYPVIKHRVLEEGTCQVMRDILRGVVTSGTGRRVNSKTYELCGKTGTAQMVNPNGGYYTDKYYATFIGFAPYKNPKISIAVVAKDPHHGHFGGTVSGPVFKGIAEKVLEYLEASGDRREPGTGYRE